MIEAVKCQRDHFQRARGGIISRRGAIILIEVARLGIAAVDSKGLAGDVTGVFRAKKKDGGDNFLEIAEAAAQIFGNSTDYNNGIGQAGIRILSWREVR